MNKKIIEIFVYMLFIGLILACVNGIALEQDMRMIVPSNIPEITCDDILFSDDFNDSIKDSNKWMEIYSNGIWEETNGRAEFRLIESGGTGARSEGIQTKAIAAMIGGDEPWDNKLEIIGNKYFITMNKQSATVDASIFSTGTVTLRIQLFIELAGSTRTNYLRSGFDDIIVRQITAENQPPNAPTIDGTKSGKISTLYDYTFNSIDPEEDAISYLIDWGDGNTDTTSGASGEMVTVQHAWSSKGNYNIKAKAMDKYGTESDWATLTVTMPCSYNIPLLQFWERLLERFPNAFPILRQLLGY